MGTVLIMENRGGTFMGSLKQHQQVAPDLCRPCNMSVNVDGWIGLGVVARDQTAGARKWLNARQFVFLFESPGSSDFQIRLLLLNQIVT